MLVIPITVFTFQLKNLFEYMSLSNLVYMALRPHLHGNALSENANFCCVFTPVLWYLHGYAVELLLANK